MQLVRRSLRLQNVRKTWLQQWRGQALFVCCALSFAVPSRAIYNIDLKAMLVCTAGAISWLAVASKWRTFKTLLPLPVAAMMVGLAILILMSSVLQPHPLANLFGRPLVRLGGLELLASIGLAVWLTTVPRRTVHNWLYISLVLVAAAAIPYAVLLGDSLDRLGGLYYQADILAAMLGCGWLFGLEQIKQHPRRHWLGSLIAAQLVILVVLCLTQTRVVLILVILLTGLYSWRSGWLGRQRGVLLSLAITASIAALFFMLPQRVTDIHYATTSLTYRWHLQSAAVTSSLDMPLFGYGAGNLSTALDCRRLYSSDLLATCRQGYFFNSSHNIFLDRALAYGWLSGLLGGLLALGVFWVARKIHYRGIELYCLLLILIYYVTNVTNIELDLVFWILLVQVYATCHANKAHPNV